MSLNVLVIVLFIDDLAVLPGRHDGLILFDVLAVLGLELHGRFVKRLVAAGAFRAPKDGLAERNIGKITEEDGDEPRKLQRFTLLAGYVFAILTAPALLLPVLPGARPTGGVANGGDTVMSPGTKR